MKIKDKFLTLKSRGKTVIEASTDVEICDDVTISDLRFVLIASYVLVFSWAFVEILGFYFFNFAHSHFDELGLPAVLLLGIASVCLVSAASNGVRCGFDTIRACRARLNSMKR